MTRAAEHGLQVSKPWGDTARYDFVVEHEARCVRVQVKSTIFKRFGGYCCMLRDSQGRAYVGDAFDFVAAYLIPEDAWYIIPEDRIRGKRGFFLNPRLKRSKYGRYKEAWHLLRGEAGTVVGIEACAGVASVST